VKINQPTAFVNVYTFAGPCEDGNKLLASIEGKEFLG
jgi:hypothetical protein